MGTQTSTMHSSGGPCASWWDSVALFLSTLFLPHSSLPGYKQLSSSKAELRGELFSLFKWVAFYTESADIQKWVRQMQVLHLYLHAQPRIQALAIHQFFFNYNAISPYYIWNVVFGPWSNYCVITQFCFSVFYLRSTAFKSFKNTLVTKGTRVPFKNGICLEVSCSQRGIIP